LIGLQCGLSFSSLVPLPGVFPFIHSFVCLFVYCYLSLCFGSYHDMLHTIIVTDYRCFFISHDIEQNEFQHMVFFVFGESSPKISTSKI
jgi:hypothetical protein